MGNRENRENFCGKYLIDEWIVERISDHCILHEIFLTSLNAGSSLFNFTVSYKKLHTAFSCYHS